FQIEWDNVVISNTGTYIGCANSDGSSGCPGNLENPRGTGDPSSPYRNWNPIEAFYGHILSGDCIGGVGMNGGIAHRVAVRAGWRSNTGTLQSAIRHESFTDLCQYTIAGTDLSTLLNVLI